MACIHRTQDDMCKKYSVDGYTSFYGYDNGSDCVGYTPSNADKVRAMSDEELARLLGGLSARAYDWVDSTEEEVKKWLEWLHKEAEE